MCTSRFGFSVGSFRPFRAWVVSGTPNPRAALRFALGYPLAPRWGFVPLGIANLGVVGDAILTFAQALKGRKRMPQSLAQILVHLVFSTKNREMLLADDIRDDLNAYIGGIVDNQKGTLLKAGSVADHIHLLIALARTCAPSDLVQEIKTGSSKWLKTKGTRYTNFHWQGGYGIFSISPSHRPALEDYIATQAEHHRVVTFQEEYRRLLEKYEIQFDERYVWD